MNLRERLRHRAEARVLDDHTVKTMEQLVERLDRRVDVLIERVTVVRGKGARARESS